MPSSSGLNSAYSSLPIKHSYVRFEALTAIRMKITFFWDVVLCRVVCGYSVCVAVNF
jgi:hypothetical protein